MTSAVLAAATSSAWLIGLSSAVSRASNSSRMRISTLSGSLRVTTTSGFLPDAMYCLLRKPTRGRPPGNRPVQVSLTALADTGTGRWFIKISLPDGCARTKRAGVPPASRSIGRVAMTLRHGGPIIGGFVAALAGARAGGGRGGQRQHRERPAGATLRQPQDRSGQCARRPGQGPRRRLDLYEGLLAGGNHRRITTRVTP